MVPRGANELDFIGKIVRHLGARTGHGAGSSGRIWPGWPVMDLLRRAVLLVISIRSGDTLQVDSCRNWVGGGRMFWKFWGIRSGAVGASGQDGTVRVQRGR